MPPKEFTDLPEVKIFHWEVGRGLVKKLHNEYDKDDLPILNNQHPLADMIIEDADSHDHGGQNNMVPLPAIVLENNGTEDGSNA